MSSVNKAILIGNLGKDPEVRYTNGGTAVCNFTLATSENYTDKEGQKQEKTEWHRIVCWGKTAEFCGEYLARGRKVYVEGRIETREWENKEGAKQFTTEINAQSVQFLDSKKDGAAPAKRSDEDDFGPPPPGAEPQQKPVAVRGDGLPTVFPGYGRSNGAPIAGASDGDLDYYRGRAVESANDPSKSRWKAKEQALIQAIDAEIASR